MRFEVPSWVTVPDTNFQQDSSYNSVINYLIWAAYDGGVGERVEAMSFFTKLLLYIIYLAA